MKQDEEVKILTGKVEHFEKRANDLNVRMEVSYSFKGVKKILTFVNGCFHLNVTDCRFWMKNVEAVNQNL